ncbi:MAG: RsmB/NOP family class I SAM-dependent RNA methyltransferase [Bacteroidales bacterium]|nr:RsmB/NOP family class I SAM-dependent RNA methyltransferase [Clostridium sp.]MCM1203019.1 RsmB/NOP family class I SAM-dependent RNA methyltransferase [Bacteroidales bacterium]
MELPIKFAEKMKEMLGAEYEDYLASFCREAHQGLRVNTAKISVEDFCKISPFALTAVPWCPNGFYYEKTAKPAKHPFYFAGLYYIQEPSAMTTASLLPIEEGDVVLDLCAAPGGKSTELAAKLHGTGLLVTNDISNSRAKALLKNIEVFGVGNVLVTSEAPNELAKRFPSFFDKILIDAPCSGEGMFRKQSSMIKAWESNGVEMFVGLQRGILKEAVRMLKPGGTIIYSTCTFSKEENEQSVEYLLSLDDSLYLKELPMIEGFDSGHPEWGLTGNEELAKCRRLWPHRIDGEGHFVAMAGKKKPADGMEIPVSEYVFSGEKLSREAEDFIRAVDYPFDLSRLDVQKDRVYYIPEKMPEVKGLRILRCGLYLGEMKKNRFEPSQSLAMFLKAEEFSNSISLSAEDDRVVRYLKGETMELSDEEAAGYRDGICLICVEQYPLGFGKLLNGTVKNKYLPGWRWM